MDVLLALDILGKNTTFQPDLGASPAELAFGCEPRLPGDVAVSQQEPLDVPKLLAELRAKAAKKPVQTSLHSKPTPYFPPAAQEATTVYVKRAKVGPLEPKWDGPYPIVNKLGKSCIEVKMGNLANGEPRTQVWHWSNCKPADVAEGEELSERPALGRKPKAKTTPNVS